MSFILDALRKSETERQRSRVPGIAHVPLSVSRPVLPPWAIAVMAVLGASAVLMAGAWWFTLASRPEPATAAEEHNRIAVALPPPVEAPRAAPAASAETRDAGALRTAASAGAQQPSSPLKRLAAEGAPPRASPETPAADRARPTAELPSAADLLARGEDLPSLRLELHVFAETPADRYVFINGKMYREGQTLQEGPELLRIDQRGAALRHQGREFLLTQ